MNAKEYVTSIRAANEAAKEAGKRRPKISYGDESLCAEVTDAGKCAVDMRPDGITVNLIPAAAVDFGRWLIDTFGEEKEREPEAAEDTEDFTHRVKLASDIVELISEYVPSLKKDAQNQ